MSSCIHLDVLRLHPQRTATLLLFVQGKRKADDTCHRLAGFVLRDTRELDESWHLAGSQTRIWGRRLGQSCANYRGQKTDDDEACAELHLGVPSFFWMCFGYRDCRAD